MLSLGDGGTADDLLQGETGELNFEERVRQMKITSCVLASLVGVKSGWDLPQKRKKIYGAQNKM